MERKKVFQNILLLFIVVGILFLTLEIGVRVFYGKIAGKNLKEEDSQKDLRPRFIYENNEAVGYRFRKNLKTTFKNIKTTQLVTNSNGLRDREYGKKDAGLYRIVVLGDSFTFGWDVESDSGYTKQLENMLNDKIAGKRFEVINCGIPGYGTDQELEFLKNIAIYYKPDLVLLGFYMGNDITDNIIGGIKRRSVENGYLLDNYLHEKVYNENFYLKKIKEILSRRSFLFSLVFDRYEKLALRLGFHEDVNPYYQLEIKQLDVFKKKYDSEVEKGIEKTVSLVENIRYVAFKNGAEMAVILIPAFYQVYPKAWNNYLSSYGIEQLLYDQNKLNENLNNIFRARKIKVLDLLEDFRHFGKKENLYLFGHWNEKGHSIAANIISDFIKKSYFSN